MSVLVLDLDHTLVHTLAAPRAPGAVPLGMPGRNLHVHVRPHARELLQYLRADQTRKWLKVAVWTAGTAAYARAVLDIVFAHADAGLWYETVETVLSRSDALPLPAGAYVKPLSAVRRKLGLDDVLLVDDDPIHARIRSNAVLQAPRYDAEQDGDAFLLQLVARLRAARAQGRPLAQA